MQDEQLTRLKGYISTGFPCDVKNLLTDLHEFWPHKEMLENQIYSTEGEQTAQMKEWTTESRSVKSITPAIPFGIRLSTENSQENSSSDSVQPPLPRLDLPVSDFSENREESQIA